MWKHRRTQTLSCYFKAFKETLKEEMIQAVWCNVFYFYSLKFKGFVVVKRTYAKATATIENILLIWFWVVFMSQPEEGILSSKSQNVHSVFVALELTCYSGAPKICVLGFCLCFQFKYYLVIRYILLIFAALLAYSLFCPFFSDSSTVFSCWEAECPAGLCLRVMVKSLLFQVTSVWN